MKLQDLIDLFLADVCGGKTNQTEAAYRSKLRRLTSFFGSDCDCTNITLRDLDRFKHDLQNRKTHMVGGPKGHEEKGGLSPFTIRTCLVTVRFLFSWAASKRYIPMNPMEGVRIQDPPKPQPKATTQETVVKLLKAAAISGPDWERARNVALVYLLRDTGGRVGGLAGIHLGDIDMKRGFIMVTEKGDIQRPLFITQHSKESLQTWLKKRAELQPVDDLLFTGCYRRGIHSEGLYRILKKLQKEAGIVGELVNPHAFRHAFARDSLLNGAELSQVSAMMGHSDTRVTSLYYARWAPKELKKTHNQYSPALELPKVEPVFEGVE